MNKKSQTAAWLIWRTPHVPMRIQHLALIRSPRLAQSGETSGFISYGLRKQFAEVALGYKYLRWHSQGPP